MAFEYDAPNSAGCPTEPEFRAAVTDLLSYDPFVPAAVRSVSVEIGAGDAGLEGVLRWRNQAGELAGERRFDASAADCSKLGQNLAFAVAVQLQLMRDAGEDEEGSVPEAAHSEREAVRSRPEVAVAPPAPSVPHAPSAPSAGQVEAGGGIGPFVVVGWSPDAALGGSLMLAGRHRAFSIQLAFEVSPPSNFERTDGSGFETTVLAGSIAPCLRFVAVAACSVLRLGQVRVQGFGVDDPRRARGVLAEGGLRFQVAQALGAGFEGRVHAEALGTLSSRTVQLNGKDVFSAPAVVFLAGIDFVGFFL